MMKVTTLFNHSDKLMKRFVLVCFVGLLVSLGVFGLLENLITFAVCITAICSLVVFCPENCIQYRSLGKAWAFYFIMLAFASANVFLLEQVIDLNLPQFYIPGMLLFALLGILGVMVISTPCFSRFELEKDECSIPDSAGAEAA